MVDASQGVEAQTLANAYLALDNNLDIIPVINKIDLPSAEPDECKRQIEDIIGLDSTTAILASAKEGTGTRRSSRRSSRVPPADGDPTAPLKALIFDSWYDAYRGVVIVVRVIDGVLRPKMKIRLMATAQDYEVENLGVFTPKAIAGRPSSASARSASSSRTSSAWTTRRSATPSPRSRGRRPSRFPASRN